VASPGNDVRTGRWFEPLLRRLPPAARYRLFLPAYEDLRQEHLDRVRSTRWRVARLVHAVLFGIATIALIGRCYRSSPGLIAIHPFRAGARTLRALLLPGPTMLRLDLRQAFRLFRQQPLFSAAAILILALGIGASTAMFSVVDAVLLEPLPFADADRLVAIDETFDGRSAAVSPVNFLDWERQTRSFQAMALYTESNMTLALGDRAEAIVGYAVSSRFFPVLGVQPVIGRFLSADDDLAGRRNVVLGHGLWRRAFGASRDVVGRQVTFDGDPYTVVGVAPEGVEWPERSEAWFSLALSDRQVAPSSRGAHYASAIARLRPGVTLDAANAEMQTIAARLAKAYPRTNADYTAGVQPLLDSVVGSARQALLLAFGAVGCLLLLACVNVSGMLMARAATRRGEMALRAALGAGRVALFRQVLVESAALAAVAAAVGVLLATWGTSALLAVIPQELPRVGGVGLNWRVLSFAVVVSACSALVFGMIPALQPMMENIVSPLKEGRRDGGAGGGRRLRGALVSLEVALALVLLVGAGLTIRSFELLTRVSPGFDPRGALTFSVSLPDGVYKEPAQAAAFFSTLVSNLAAVPGVTSAGTVMMLPVATSGFGGTFSIDGRPDGSGASEPRAQLRPVSPGYFRALGLGIVSGRGFSDQDGGNALPVAIVSETTARRFWPGENPIGKRLRMHVSAVRSREPFREIVGVVPDVTTSRLDRPAAPVVYVPHAQHPTGYMTILMRTRRDPTSLAPDALSVLRRLDRSLVAIELQTLEDRVSSARGAHRFRALLFGVFAGIAFLLAIVGLYSVVAFAAQQRRHEVGVRMVLGATPSQVVRLMVAEGLRPVVAGMLVGGVSAFLLARLLDSLLFGVRTFEPAVVALVALLLGAAASAACYLPARRSARVDPRDALRSD
jgi:putative ABC transport system permease protein